MKNESAADDVSLQSYFEARSTIRELEQRQFAITQFYLGAFSAVIGASIGIMQYVEVTDREMLSVALVLVSTILSVSLFFSWCSVTMMIHRVALFCLDVIDAKHRERRNVFWETWVRSDRNKSPAPFLLESTLLVFLFPLAATFSLSLYINNEPGGHLFASISTTLIGISLLISQYILVLRQIKSAWKNS